MTKKDKNPIFIESKNFVHNTSDISKEQLLDLFLETVRTDAENIFEENKSLLKSAINSSARSFIEEELEQIFNYNDYPEISGHLNNLSAHASFNEFVQSAVKSNFMKELNKRISFDLSLKQPLMYDANIKDATLDENKKSN